MEISWIVTDLDRTLLRTDKTVSDYTAEVFRRCREKGIKLVAATARRRSATGMTERIGFDGMVLGNGAQVLAGDRELEHHGIEAALTRRLIADVLQEDPTAKVSVVGGDRLYANFDVTSVWEKVEYTRCDFTDLPEVLCEKIGIGLKNGNWQRFLPLLPPHLYIQPCDGDALAFIMHREATKGNGVLRLAREWGLDPHSAVCFGDDHNDLSMFACCGRRVAMQNAIDEVKEAADCICDSNDADGVAHWLEEHLL